MTQDAVVTKLLPDNMAEGAVARPTPPGGERACSRGSRKRTRFPVPARTRRLANRARRQSTAATSAAAPCSPNPGQARCCSPGNRGCCRSCRSRGTRSSTRAGNRGSMENSRRTHTRSCRRTDPPSCGTAPRRGYPRPTRSGSQAQARASGRRGPSSCPQAPESSGKFP